MFTIKCSSRNHHCQYLKTKIGQIRPYRPHWFATRRLLIYITQQDDRDRVAETIITRPCPSKLGRGSRSYGFREHQQAVPPGASEHRNAQPRPEQVLTPTASAPRLGNKKEQVLSCCARLRATGRPRRAIPRQAGAGSSRYALKRQ